VRASPISEGKNEKRQGKLTLGGRRFFRAHLDEFHAEQIAKGLLHAGDDIVETLLGVRLGEDCASRD
jgi:hypothetical protein